LEPSKLHNKHAFSELRELPRIFSYVAKHGVPKDISPTYILGKGHVTFFSNKLNWLLERYEQLYAHLISLGYNLSFTPQMLQDKYEDLLVAETLKGDIEYFPTDSEIMINLKRLIEKKGDYYAEEN
jgi:deoxyribonuclease (pyrimidine dimer)